MLSEQDPSTGYQQILMLMGDLMYYTFLEDKY